MNRTISMASRLCEFYEVCWDSGAYAEGFARCDNPAKIQAFEIVVQAIEAREDRWVGISKHELYKKLHFVLEDEKLGPQRAFINDSQEEELDGILEVEDKVADIVFGLLGGVSPTLMERGLLGIDGRPQECDTTDKKALWDTNRALMESACRRRENPACSIRVEGWLSGVFMGRE